MHVQGHMPCISKPYLRPHSEMPTEITFPTCKGVHQFLSPTLVVPCIVASANYTSLLVQLSTSMHVVSCVLFARTEALFDIGFR